MLPNNEISEPDEDGVITSVKYSYEFGQLLKTTTRFRKLIKIVKIPKRVIERRKWKKFGEKDDENTRTSIADEVFIETQDSNNKITLDIKLPIKKEISPKKEQPYRYTFENNIKLENSIWVENLPNNMFEDDIFDLFKKYGKIKSLIMGKQCCILVFYDNDSYIESFDLNRKFINKSLLSVNKFNL